MLNEKYTVGGKTYNAYDVGGVTILNYLKEHECSFSVCEFVSHGLSLSKTRILRNRNKICTLRSIMEHALKDIDRLEIMLKLKYGKTPALWDMLNELFTK